MRGKFESILGTVGNTPIVRIGKLAPPGANLFVKIEAFNPLGSVKDRLALGVIEDAERSEKLKPGQTVIEATSGNTGIGLAMVCAQKGYPLVVTMTETFSIERRKLMRFLGAKVVLTPAKWRFNPNKSPKIRATSAAVTAMATMRDKNVSTGMGRIMGAALIKYGRNQSNSLAFLLNPKGQCKEPAWRSK